MSGTSADTILIEPQKTVGAQDLQRLCNCSKTGFLRRQGALERFFKFLRWRQRFLVVSRGCIYIYKDEFSGSPLKAESLRLFNQVKRLEVQTPVWAFTLLPLDTTTTKSMLFSCSSDEIRKEWMRELKTHIICAHNLSPPPVPGGDIDEYVYIEKEVDVPKPKPPQQNNSNKEEDIGDQPEEDYSTIDDKDVPNENPAEKVRKRPTFKPAPPKQSYTQVDVSQKSKPKLRSPSPEPKQGRKTTVKTKAPPQSPSKPPYEYDGTDREEVEKILTLRPEGTFLVRKSRQDRKKVLSVNVEGVLKEFKIYDKDGKVTLDNNNYFDTLEELLEEYTDHNLPKKETKLYRAYSVTDTKYIN